MATNLWKEYCLKSSIHGLRYVVEPKRPLYERLVWTVLLTMAASFVVYMHWESWSAFSESPTQIVVDNPRYPLEKVDFPAITVCPINKSMYSKVLEVMVEVLGNTTEEEQGRFLNTMLALSLTGYPFYNSPSEFANYVNFSLVYLNPDDIEGIMKRVLPSVDDMFSNCCWRGTQYDCDNFWRLQRTEEGFCYSFNSKTAERNNPSPICPPFEVSNGTYEAIRNNAAGKITGLEFFLKDLESEYLPNDMRVRGYSVAVHSPENFPDVSTSYLVYKDAGKVHRISVTVSTTIGHETLNNIDERKRKCYMPDDYAHMSSSEIPTIVGNDESNCYQSCRLRAIAKYCNCTPYYFRPTRDDINHCGIRHIDCLEKVNVLQRNTQAPEGEPGFPKWSLPKYMNCSCPQPCSFVTYSTEVRHTFADFLTDKKKYYIYMDIMYKELFAISYSRFLKYTLKDLLVSFGGVASLFLGFSLVGVAELLYYTINAIHIFIIPPSVASHRSADWTTATNTPRGSYVTESQMTRSVVSHRSRSVEQKNLDDYVIDSEKRRREKTPDHIQPFLF